MSWLTAQEIANHKLPDMPTSKRRVNTYADRHGWAQAHAEDGSALCRKRKGRGGGFEYHISLLPLRAQKRLEAQSRQTEKGAVEASGAALWERFEQLSDKARAEAQRRLGIMQRIEALEHQGFSRNQASAMIACETNVCERTIWNWRNQIEGQPQADWLPLLAPKPRGAAATKTVKRAACSNDAFEVFKADYLRAEKPSAASCYDRLVRIAAQRKWQLPSLKTLQRRLTAEVPAAAIVLARDGHDALKASYPAMRRDRSHFGAMEAVNADCHTVDVFVKMPDGKIMRPTLIAVQDLRSGKFVGWRFDDKPNANGVRLAMHDMFRDYGIPRLVYFDNGREFASKMITGGQKTRFRFKVKDDDVQGLLTSLGIKVHWTLPYSGQSKPIERAFRDLCDHMAKHPAFAGAYTGNHVMAKPENYGSKAIAYDEFVRVADQAIRDHNARSGRQGQGMDGRSCDEVFAQSYAQEQIRRATEPQLRMALLAAERVTARRPNGMVYLLKNGFWAEFLLDHLGGQLMIRFDPDDLSQGVHVYDAESRYLGHAPMIEAHGFNDVDAAREHARNRKNYEKRQREMLELERSMRPEDIAAMLPDDEPVKDKPAARVVQLVAGNTALSTPVPDDYALDDDEETNPTINNVTALFERITEQRDV
ncbi:MAG: transposase domain-containing protein [Alphaproteobacteria bacterium]